MNLAVGVLGGTFDPIHVGHVQAALSVHEQLKLSAVILVPTGDPWQKSAHAPRIERLSMAQLAVAGHPELSVSSVDTDRPGPTYTVDTLRDLRVQHPHAEFFFIVGADALAGLASWREAESLASLATFVGVTRPGERFLMPDLEALEVVRVDVPAVDVSSTQVRARVASGESIEGLVPDAVAEYIRANGLYRVGDS